ncbi:MAG: glycoside hydrolase family 65 protein [Phycisphaerales bacterium]|nr:MAG: glycoside hydrolase family 65 protein [Phycisphaerales bacterium]
MIPPDAMENWTIINEKFDAHSLGQHNSVFTVSNGYLGLKGNLQEDRNACQPVTLINGVYDELDMFSLIRASNEERRYLDPEYFDTAGKSPAVANLPDPLYLRVFVGDREIAIDRGEVIGFTQLLQMDRGVYTYRFEYRDSAGRTTNITATRFASLAHPHRAFMRYRITPVDHDAPVRVLSGINGAVVSDTTRERQFRLTGLDADDTERCRLHARTPARSIDVHVGVENTCRHGPTPISTRGVVEHDAVYTLYEFEAEQDKPICIDRCIAVACSEDERHGAVADVDAELEAATRQGFVAAADEQREQWTRLWNRADVEIDGDDDAQRYLRFCLYHLLAAAPRHTDKLSVPVKLLTGQYYQGNVFYDVDLYIVPFYLFTFPELARTCLNWRCIGLEPGRAIAREFGYAGAKFAWQAGPYGEECLGRWWRFTHTNVHINSDVAYTLMQYHHATGDENFMRDRGIDVLVETARFFASRVEHDAGRDAYDMHDVAGPDEGHCESTNNFYTNYLAIRNLRWAADMLDDLRRNDPDACAHSLHRLNINENEPDRWRHVADRLTLLLDPETKVYEQCRGFYQLKPVPPGLLADRKAWFETVFPYQALNQPDVVMAMVLFRDEFDHQVRRANWNFYKDKSMNFSSMSFAVNSIMAADTDDMDQAYHNFIVSAGMDIDEQLTGRRDTHEGLHGSAAGGAWMAAVFGFGGVHLSQKGLRINPNLPPKWKALRFNLAYRGQVLNVSVDQHHIAVTAARERPEEVTLTIAGQPVTLTPGHTYRAPYR